MFYTYVGYYLYKLSKIGVKSLQFRYKKECESDLYQLPLFQSMCLYVIMSIAQIFSSSHKVTFSSLLPVDIRKLIQNDYGVCEDIIDDLSFQTHLVIA